eukprot:CAMPEP_0174706458 /NCGR_PEP_ID=MMETSP1094-20130205/9296_1 /TAXON_ID=156173 /ORGANISM="Chrysochromulina brevifilum, Strain UTEX LB 985" /LENGTH=33 /DNA_ID= /DNA_START= /DNA_END= /DNA_ORIENTATION=
MASQVFNATRSTTLAAALACFQWLHGRRHVYLV